MIYKRINTIWVSCLFNFWKVAIASWVISSYIMLIIQSTQIKIEFRLASLWTTRKYGTSQTISELLTVILRTQVTCILHETLIGKGQPIGCLRRWPNLILIVWRLLFLFIRFLNIWLRYLTLKLTKLLNGFSQVRLINIFVYIISKVLLRWRCLLKLLYDLFLFCFFQNFLAQSVVIRWLIKW